MKLHRFCFSGRVSFIYRGLITCCLEHNDVIWENDLNVWSLKILSKIGHGTAVIDKFKISKLLRLIKEQKTTCFTNTGSVYEALIILDQYFSHDPQITQVSNLDWLLQIFKHRDASIRIMGYQMASIIATSEQGA